MIYMQHAYRAVVPPPSGARRTPPDRVAEPNNESSILSPARVGSRQTFLHAHRRSMPRRANRLLRLLLTISLPCLTIAAGAPAAFTLDGVVRDRLKDTPLADATVAMASSQRVVRTGPDGAFSFRQLQVSGPEELIITHPDYRTVRIPLGALEAGAWHLEIGVTRTAEVVGGSPPEEDRAR